MDRSQDKIELFENVPIKKAAISLIIPTVLSQLVMLVYNMADTWFIGKTGDPVQVAAVTVTYPIFMIMNGIANLFGIGGGSLISRMLGSGQREETTSIANYILWGSGIVTLIYSMITYFFCGNMLQVLGVDSSSLGYAKDYLFWCVCIGGLPTVLNLVLANIIRSEGESKVSSKGMSLGGLLNMVMDPIFIFVFHMGVAGAALSTCISNTISFLYLFYFVIKNNKDTLVKIDFKLKKVDIKKQFEIYTIGTPASLQILLAALSNAVLIGIMSHYNVYAISGMGVMQKVDSIPFQAIMGISEGILPLVAYNYASGNKNRMDEAVRFALTRGILCAFIFLAVYLVFAPNIVQFFINDPKSILYGAHFVRLRVLALPFITVEFMLIAVFQGIGGAKQAFFLSIFRKGIFDLPLMFLADYLWPMYGIMLVQPIMECIGCIIAFIMYKRITVKKQVNHN